MLLIIIISVLLAINLTAASLVFAISVYVLLHENKSINNNVQKT